MARASRGEPWEKANNSFATTLLQLMKEQPVTTQAQLAEITGKTRQTISQYVNGVSEPGYDTLVKIADHFKVSLDYLLGRSKARTLDNSIQAACNITGLTERSIYALRRYMDVDDGYLSLYEKYGGRYASYAIDMVNEFISFALNYDEDKTPFKMYLAFRQQNEEHRESVEKWIQMTQEERQAHFFQMVDLHQTTFQGGFYPLFSKEASDYFRIAFCDNFKDFLKDRYPLAEMPKQNSKED